MNEEERIESGPEDEKIESSEEVNESISQEETIEQTEITNQKSDIITSDILNMEVHHHPHAEKKNLKEYLLEGLMIFIAVTLGFFAENLREYLNDEHVTTQNMQSMIEDLRSDSTMFSTTLVANEYSVRMIDTLVDMLSNKSSGTGHIYFLARNITAVADAPRPDTRTFEQMRTEGSLRLLKSNSLVNDITSYYQSLEWFKMGNDGELRRMDEVITANSAVFNGAVLKRIFSSEFINSEHNAYRIEEPDNNPPLFSNDNGLINTIIVRYSYLQSALKENNGTIELEIKRCNQLIEDLKKEYTL
jgi:hypothetical protein